MTRTQTRKQQSGPSGQSQAARACQCSANSVAVASLAGPGPGSPCMTVWGASSILAVRQKCAGTPNSELLCDLCPGPGGGDRLRTLWSRWMHVTAWGRDQYGVPHSGIDTCTPLYRFQIYLGPSLAVMIYKYNNHYYFKKYETGWSSVYMYEQNPSEPRQLKPLPAGKSRTLTWLP